MSVYESVKRASLAIKRKLFDFNLSVVGREVKVVRIRKTRDIFDDFSAPEVLSSDEIIISVAFPRELPLERYRINGSVEVGESRTYFYEILPVEIYTQLKDNVEKDDFIFFYMEDEKNNLLPFLFQVTDSFGRFEIGMVWRKYYVAPYNGSDLDEVLSYLNNYTTSNIYNDYKEENPDSHYLVSLEDQLNYYHEPYKNLFHLPLNPRNQFIEVDSSVVIQCAFGSIEIPSYGTVTPSSPLQIEVESKEILALIVSGDCKFPSVYESNVLHPFVVGSIPSFFIQEFFKGDLRLSFDLGLEYLGYSEMSSIILTDNLGNILSDGFIIIGSSYDPEMFRSVFFVKDGTGSFVSIRVQERSVLSLVYKIEDLEQSFVLGELEGKKNVGIQLFMEDGSLFVQLEDKESIEILGSERFIEQVFYLGFEPEHHLNDFIRNLNF